MTAHYVYRCYDRDGVLLYIGCTGSLTSRLEAHRRSSGWAHLATKVIAKVYPDKAMARAAERQAIQSERPRFNIHGRRFPGADSTLQEIDDYILARSMRPYLTDHTQKIVDGLKRMRAMRQLVEPVSA